MDKETLQIILALLPFTFLLIAFLIFRLDVIRLSLYTWLLEVLIVIAAYQWGGIKVFQASVWGNISIWSGFAVIYTGQLFGQAYKSAGLMSVLLTIFNKLMLNKAGKAMTLCAVAGNLLGAFNGFTTYPLTVPGLVALGISRIRAAAGFLVYFSWSIPFVSLFIAVEVAATASNLPIKDISQVIGVVTIPLVIISIVGFFRIIGLSLAERENLLLAGGVSAGNIMGILLFTQVFKGYYIMTLISAGLFCLVFLYFYCRSVSSREANNNTASPANNLSMILSLRAFAPLALGALLVLLRELSSIKVVIEGLAFKVQMWSYSPVTINLFTTPGFYILITALSCYCFSANKWFRLWQDVKIVNKQARESLITLFMGGAMIYLMVDSGQIALLAEFFSAMGEKLYVLVLCSLAFITGITFGQGLPADFLLSNMQSSAAQILGVPHLLLVGLVVVATMGLANPLQLSVLCFVSSLANIKGKEGEVFRMALPWQLLQLVFLVVSGIILLKYFFAFIFLNQQESYIVYRI